MSHIYVTYILTNTEKTDIQQDEWYICFLDYVFIHAPEYLWYIQFWFKLWLFANNIINHSIKK